MKKKNNDIQRFKEVLKYFFQNIENILTKSEYTETLKIEEEKLNLLDNIDNVRAKLIRLSRVKDENIDLFLSYYYIHYRKKLFIQFINNDKYKGSLKNNLITHKKIFGDFTTKIINQELIDETEDVPQLVSLMELLPSIVEFYKILNNEEVFSKFTNLKQIYRRAINPLLILKPNINDDIDLLEKYFKGVYDLFLTENIYPIIIKENFFLDYYNCFGEQNEDFHKNLVIIEMLSLYNSRASKKLKTEEILKLHFEKGISLLKKKKLKNEDFMKFIKSFPDKSTDEELIKCFPDGIDFRKENKTFIDDILNTDKYELRDFLGDNYEEVFEKIFRKFTIPKELVELRYWQLNDETPAKFINIFMGTIRRIWLHNPENNMFGLENLFADVFSKASLYTKNYKNIINALEDKIEPEKLMGIYSVILLKNFKMKDEFKVHIINYIISNDKHEAINLWFLMCTKSDREEKIALLEEKLNEEYAVKYHDFVDYPKRANGRISLFTKLKNKNYIPENFGNSQYYEDSMNSKNDLKKNIFKNAMTMDINLQKIFDLISDFFCKNDDEIMKIGVEITNFRDKVEEGKKYYDSLKKIQKYWETFFPKQNKDKLDDLKKKIETFENTMLENVENEENANQQFLNEFLPGAEEGIEFIDSIFFMEIYKRFKNLKDKELVRYKTSLVQFKLLAKIGENNDLSQLKDELKNNIIDAVKKKENLLNGELEFLKKFFNFGDKTKYKNFNIKSLRNNIRNLAKLKKDEEIKDEQDNENEGEVVGEPPEIINLGQKDKEEINKLKEKIKLLCSEVFYYSCIFEKNNEKDLYIHFFFSILY